MKPASNELYELIHALTEKEKSRFRKYCLFKADSDSSNYLKIFDAYEKQKQADEAKVKATCKIENFSRVKNYLQHQLLSFIEENENNSIHKEISNQIAIADALFNRSLYKHSLSVLIKARQKASDYQMFPYLLTIEELITRNYLSLGNLETYIKENWVNTMHSLTDQVKNEAEMSEYVYRLRIFWYKQNTLMRSQENVEELATIVLPMIERGEDFPQSHRSKISFHINAGYYYKQVFRFDEAIYHFKKCVDLYEGNEVIKNSQLLSYILALNNLMFVYSGVKSFPEIRALIDKLELVEVKSKRLKILKFQVWGLFVADYYRHVIDTDRKIKLKQIETEFPEYADLLQLQSHIAIVNCISVNYFIEGDFKKALEWVNKLDDMQNNALYRGILSIIKIYTLIIHYELGKSDYLDYAITNTYRYLLNHKQFYKFEKLAISTLRQILAADSLKKQKEILSVVYSELLVLQNDPHEREVFSIFNFAGWIRCRLNNESYLNLMNG